MSSPGRLLGEVDAVVFDLDGVLTDTADLHHQAWGELVERIRRPDEPALSPAEYRDVLDGRDRISALSDLLARRGHHLAVGTSSDPPGVGTLHALAAVKQGRYLELLHEHGARVFPDARQLLNSLRGSVPLAIVSASRNLPAVLERTGLADLFRTTVDGNDCARLGLAGKPAPDSYLEAARRLGLPPGSLAMVEDAVAGVAAGHAAGYHTVVGIDRVGTRSEQLGSAGADVVVTSLTELLPPS